MSVHNTSSNEESMSKNVKHDVAKQTKTYDKLKQKRALKSMSLSISMDIKLSKD